MATHNPNAVAMSGWDWVAEQARRYEESGGTEATDMNGSPCLLLDCLLLDCLGPTQR